MKHGLQLHQKQWPGGKAEHAHNLRKTHYAEKGIGPVCELIQVEGIAGMTGHYDMSIGI